MKTKRIYETPDLVQMVLEKVRVICESANANLEDYSVINDYEWGEEK